MSYEFGFRHNVGNQPHSVSGSMKDFRHQLRLELLEDRRLMAVDAFSANAVGSYKYQFNDPEGVAAAVAAITTTGSSVPMYTQPDELFATGGDKSEDEFQLQLVNSTLRIKLDQFRAAPQFAGINGSGFSAVVLDTGIDLNHPHFGADANSDGIADRIVYQQSFVGGATADDQNGHGTHVSGTIGSEDATHTGMAPSASLISLQTNNASGQGSFGNLELALQWVVNNAATYNIASVNMSLGDGGNYSEAGSLYGLGDELAALAAMDVIVVSSSGNSYGVYNAPGVGYPSADPNSLSIGNRFTNSFGIDGSSQRHPELSTVFAPGSPIIAARHGGGTRSLSGTSMSAPHVAGVAVLMQQLAVQELGRRLTMDEFEFLVRSSAVDLALIPETGAYYQTLDVLAMGNAILGMKNANVELVGSSFDVASALTRGDSSQLNFSVTNLGAQVSGSVAIDVYLSRNQMISETGDLLIGTTTIDVPAGGTFSGTVGINLPAPNHAFWGFANAYTIGMVIDRANLVGEVNEGNNLNQGQLIDMETLPIANPPSDLRGLALSASPVGLLRGESLTVDYQLENVGLGPSRPTAVAFYLSSDGVIDPATDLLVSTYNEPTILAGQSGQSRSITLTLPENSHPIWQTGTQYTLGMVADATAVETEGNESNNLNRGLGIDMVQFTILPPPTRISGLVFDDADNNGVRLEPFSGNVVFERAAGSTVSPQITTTLEFNDLPSNRSSATLRVQAYGDLDEIAEYATVNIDGLISARVFDKQPITGGILVNADETVVLSGPAWEAAMLDGNLSMQVNFTNPGSFITSSTSWLRLTLSFEAESSETYHVTSTVNGRTLFGRNSTVNLAATRPAIGDGVLTLVALGDVGGLEEFAVVDLEGAVQFTLLDATEGAADNSESIESVSIPMATLNSLIADGNLQALVAFNAAVNNNFPGNFFQLRLDYPIASEDGIAGVVVNLDLNEDGIFDTQVPTQADDPATSIDETGRYEFVDIGTGDFGVELSVPEDWQQTLPGTAGYSVVLEEGEAKSGYDFGLFSSDVNPPDVMTVYASSTTWSPQFIGTLGTNGIGLAVGPGQGPLPWNNVNQLVIQFSEGIFNFTPSAFELRSSAGIVPASVVFDPFLSRAIVQASQPLSFNKYRLAIADSLRDLAGNALDGDGNGTAGGVFNLRFDVLPADTNRDGRVNASDLPAFAASFNQSAGAANFNPVANWNGDDRVNGIDLSVFSTNFNRQISSLSEPGAPFGGGGSGGRLFASTIPTPKRDERFAARDAFFSQLDGEESGENKRKKLLGAW